MVAHLHRVIVVIFADGDDHRLHRGQPQRECPGKMLNQNAAEAFDAAEQRAVDHQWPFARVVAVNVFNVEALRQVRVNLHCAQLPVALQGIAEDQIQLGAIKCRLAFLHCVAHPHLLAGVDDGVCGVFPQFVRAHILG